MAFELNRPLQQRQSRHHCLVTHLGAAGLAKVAKEINRQAAMIGYLNAFVMYCFASGLGLLLVLTVCDIRAVGPNVWNGWKAALLRQLYNATERVLSGGTLAGGHTIRDPEPKYGLAVIGAAWSLSGVATSLVI